MIYLRSFFNWPRLDLTRILVGIAIVIGVVSLTISVQHSLERQSLRIDGLRTRLTLLDLDERMTQLRSYADSLHISILDLQIWQTEEEIAGLRIIAANPRLTRLSGVIEIRDSLATLERLQDLLRLIRVASSPP